LDGKNLGLALFVILEYIELAPSLTLLVLPEDVIYLVDPCPDSNPVQISQDYTEAWRNTTYLRVARVAYPFSTFCSSPLPLCPPMVSCHSDCVNFLIRRGRDRLYRVGRPLVRRRRVGPAMRPERDKLCRSEMRFDQVTWHK
jgi:hypothetical protein